MDMKHLMEWLELAKKYQSGDFWNSIFEQASVNDFMKEVQDFPPPPGTERSTGQKQSFPPTDIYLTDDEVLIVSNLAGYRKENLQLSLAGTKLMIKGTGGQMNPGTPVLKERHQGDFQRVIELPEPVSSNELTAKFHSGLLFISYKRQFKNEEYVEIE
ncbi:Hsp20/alpha crystallin family protein [Neobacillus dielmonensis]|uniref:Hsp20/alpha crystallin family protein n=1 Tax=Neobacillus dielmonensis TaxID=1347369 RepID=UPI0005AAC9EE|nr:Hsp20/alpha crystallin family protein [Neobacillus dielmonensis]